MFYLYLRNDFVECCAGPRSYFDWLHRYLINTDSSRCAKNKVCLLRNVLVVQRTPSLEEKALCNSVKFMRKNSQTPLLRPLLRPPWLLLLRSHLQHRPPWRPLSQCRLLESVTAALAAHCNTYFPSHASSHATTVLASLAALNTRRTPPATTHHSGHWRCVDPSYTAATASASAAPTIRRTQLQPPPTMAATGAVSTRRTLLLPLLPSLHRLTLSRTPPTTDHSSGRNSGLNGRDSGCNSGRNIHCSPVVQTRIRRDCYGKGVQSACFFFLVGFRS